MTTCEQIQPHCTCTSTSHVIVISHVAWIFPSCLHHVAHGWCFCGRHTDLHSAYRFAWSNKLGNEDRVVGDNVLCSRRRKFALAETVCARSFLNAGGDTVSTRVQLLGPASEALLLWVSASAEQETGSDSFKEVHGSARTGSPQRSCFSISAETCYSKRKLLPQRRNLKQVSCLCDPFLGFLLKDAKATSFHEYLSTLLVSMLQRKKRYWEI